MKEKSRGKKRIRTKAIVWDIFMVPCAKRDKNFPLIRGKSLKKHRLSLLAPLLSPHLLSVFVATTHFQVP